MHKALKSVAIEALAGHEQVMACAEKDAPKKIQEHVAKMRKQTNVLRDLIQKTSKDQESVIQMNQELINYIRLSIAEEYQMVIITKCPHQLIKIQTTAVQKFIPYIKNMRKEIDQKSKGLNASKRDRPHTKETLRFTSNIATQLQNTIGTLTVLVSCASEHAHESTIKGHIRKIEIASAKVRECIMKISKTNTLGDTMDILQLLFNILLELIQLISNDMYLVHVFQHCQKDIYRANVATGERSIKMLSSISKFIERKNNG
jgi:hypothetical protein